MEYRVVEDRMLPNSRYYLVIGLLLIPATLLTFPVWRPIKFNPWALWLYFWPIWVFGIGWTKQKRHRPDGQTPG